MIDIIVLVAGLSGLAACIWGALGSHTPEERTLESMARPTKPLHPYRSASRAVGGGRGGARKPNPTLFRRNM